jgi:phosphatidylglycerophosphate synthase
MRAFPIVVIVALAGYAGAPWWWSLLCGGACLTLEGWWEKFKSMRRHGRASWSTKITTYFITSVLSNVCLAALGYGFGRLLRLWTTP